MNCVLGGSDGMLIKRKCHNNLKFKSVTVKEQVYEYMVLNEKNALRKKLFVPKFVFLYILHFLVALHKVDENASLKEN